MPTPSRVKCPECGREQSLTILGRFRQHGPKEDPCGMSGLLQSEEPCQPNISPTTNQKSNDAPDPAPLVTPTTDSASVISLETHTTPTTATPPKSPRKAETTLTLPGVDQYEQGMSAAAGYDLPGKLPKAVTAQRPMNDREKHIATMVKEIFYQYVNRSDRSTQEHLGPSQIGTPCDRRLIMHLLGMPHVNPGTDKWAAFKGTCIHKGLAEMFEWADANQGRFATEMRVELESKIVPGGTLDLLDRVLFCVDDHKVPGNWSLDKMKVEGPPDLYKTQLQVYGMGARRRGERVEWVALICWPGEKSTLEDLFVWVAPYDPAVARRALQRVDALQARIDKAYGSGEKSRLDVIAETTIADDCRYCPYHMRDAKDLSHGACNGRV